MKDGLVAYRSNRTARNRVACPTCEVAVCAPCKYDSGNDRVDGVIHERRYTAYLLTRSTKPIEISTKKWREAHLDE